MKKPYVTLKFAQTLDGKIAASDGSSKWISGKSARKFSHKLRSKSDGILVGVGTVLSDNPSLQTRLATGRNPIRIIIDGKLRTPLDAKVVKTVATARTIIATTKKAPRKKIEELRKKNIEVIILPARKGGDVDLKVLMRILYKKGTKKLLVEGGKKVITSFLKAGLADRVIVIISPKFLGKGIESIGDLGIGDIKHALKLRFKDVKRARQDIIYTADICEKFTRK